MAEKSCDPQKRRFRFCKIFCPETCSEKMEISISCMKSERRVLQRKVLLRNQLMKSWSVEITEIGHALFFQNGWKKFVEDNSFISGDCLVFSNDNDYDVFDFTVFDSSGFDKMAVEGTHAKLVDVDVKKEQEVDEDDHHTDSKRKRCNASGSKRAASAMKSDIPEHFGADLFKSGRYMQPANPYFVTRVRRSRIGSLYIPKEVIKDHNMVIPPTVILRDSNGNEWTTNAHIWRDGRTWLTGGWRSLCKRNLVGVNDRCICEFLPQTGNCMVLQVTVVRE